MGVVALFAKSMNEIATLKTQLHPSEREQIIRTINSIPDRVDTAPRVYDPKLERGKEVELKKVCDKLFGVPFKKTRGLRWLVNPHTGKRLELDLYNPDLRIAIESQGIIHYQWIKAYHKTFNDFKRQQERDAIKRQLCKANGVKLIVVPFWIEVSDLEAYVLKMLVGSHLLPHQ